MDHRNESRKLSQEEKTALFNVALRFATIKPDAPCDRIAARFAAALRHPGCKTYAQGEQTPQWLPSIAEQIVNDAKRYGLIEGDPINEEI